MLFVKTASSCSTNIILLPGKETCLPAAASETDKITCAHIKGQMKDQDLERKQQIF